jgi:NMD protein affecting ribosome stability and mRNA decay
MTMKRAKYGTGGKEARLPFSTRRLGVKQPDPYTARRPPSGPAVCQECHAIFEKKRWRFDESAYEALIVKVKVKLITCPACLKIRDRYPEGELTLRWPGIPDHRRDVIGLLRKEEVRAQKVNPLERIMRIEGEGGEVRVLTTNVKLAQRLGRELERAYHGKTHYHWAHRDRLVRVVWEREE